MDLSNIKEFIVQEKLINKILNSPDKVYPLGTFKSSEEFNHNKSWLLIPNTHPSILGTISIETSS